MKRAILKWWISHSIDQSVACPGWLRAQIERDAELRNFERRARRLEHGLRAEAGAWRLEARAREDLAPSAIRTRPPSVSPGWAWWLAAAAIMLLVTRLLSTLPVDYRRKPTISSAEVARRTATAATDSTVLLQLLDASETAVRPWQRVMNPSHWPDAKWPLPSVSQATAVAEHRTESVWSEMKSSFYREQQLLTSDLVSACNFFSRKLPLSAARLMENAFRPSDAVDS